LIIPAPAATRLIVSSMLVVEDDGLCTAASVAIGGDIVTVLVACGTEVYKRKIGLEANAHHIDEEHKCSLVYKRNI
jgi:hypothetical protein